MKKRFQFLLCGILSSIATISGAIDPAPRMNIRVDEVPTDMGPRYASADYFYVEMGQALKYFAPGASVNINKPERFQILKEGKLWMDLPREDGAREPELTATIYSPPGSGKGYSTSFTDIVTKLGDKHLVNIELFAALFDTSVDVDLEDINLLTPKYWLQRLGISADKARNYTNDANLIDNFGISPPADTLRMYVRPTRPAFVQIYRVSGGTSKTPLLTVEDGKTVQFIRGLGDFAVAAPASKENPARVEVGFPDKNIGDIGMYAAIVTSKQVEDPLKAIQDGKLKQSEYSVVGLQQRTTATPINFQITTVKKGETWAQIEERVKTGSDLLKELNGYESISTPKAGERIVYISSIKPVVSAAASYKEMGWYGTQTSDTLEKLASQWGVPVADILRANPSRTGQELVPGDLIVRIAPTNPIVPVETAAEPKYYDKQVTLPNAVQAFSQPRQDAEQKTNLAAGTKVLIVQGVEPGFVEAVDSQDKTIFIRFADVANMLTTSEPRLPVQGNPLIPADTSRPFPVLNAPVQPRSLADRLPTKEFAAVAKSFDYIGTPYAWGGSNLRRGIDCSHFVQEVYRNYGFRGQVPSAPVINQETFGNISHVKPGLKTIWRGMKSYSVGANPPTSLSLLRPGDRFIHQTKPGTAVSGSRHTGLYVGKVRYRGRNWKNLVIHSSGRRGIDVDEITGYLWKGYRYSCRGFLKPKRRT